MSDIDAYNVKLQLYKMQVEVMDQQTQHAMDAVRYSQMIKPPKVEDVFTWVGTDFGSVWHAARRIMPSAIGHSTLCGQTRYTSGVDNPQGELCQTCKTEVAKWIVENL